ncbi:hypothetical protein ACL0VS_19190 [Chryseobacterium sp. PMSZPI]|uniref:hypothetical protein n=1 Tax=Chryseobacterium sp. PMSZPI TaxID=1033900 RepID=UPI0039A2C815
MKKNKIFYTSFFFLLTLVSCIAINAQNLKEEKKDIYVIYQSKFYMNSVQVGETFYNSKTGIYKIYEKTPSTFIDQQIIVHIDNKNLIKIYNEYKKLNISNKKLCTKSSEEDVLIEDSILFNSEQINKVRKCSVNENEQADIYMITSHLLNLIKSSEQYKKAFPNADWEM